jgi:uncharacterized damage-inducible protein DinB
MRHGASFRYPAVPNALRKEIPMDQAASQMMAQLKSEVRRRLLEESLPRLEKCLSLLSEEEVWIKPNSQTNSIGNLILHLRGNVAQWIGSGLGDWEDRRQRSLEFSSSGGPDKEELLRAIHETLLRAVAVVEEMNLEDFLRKRQVQCYEEWPVSILMHVVEHFSYHVGQIGLLVKLRTESDLGYYAGKDLEAKGGHPTPGPLSQI